MSPISLELIGLARRIARWLIEHVVAHGALRVGHYMLLRADTVFRRRLAKAKTARRKRWLRGRIARWKAIGKWLIDRAVELGICIAAEGEALLGAAKKVPLVAKCERFVA